MSIRRILDLRLWAVLPMVGVALSGCGGPAAVSTVDTATPAATVQAAGATAMPVTGKLVLYTSRAETLVKPVTDAFTKANPGVEVALLTGKDSELAAKMLEERANPQADFFINTDIISMASLGKQDLFVASTSKVAQSLPEAYRAEDGSWVALTLRARVIMYNTNLVKEAELPKSMFDLTDSKWNGQVGSADSTNGSIQGQVVAMRSLLGEQKTEEFIKGLVANETRFFGGHTDVRKAVGTGELKLGLVNHYYYQLSKAEGAPVGIVYPDQAGGEMGLLVNSTNGAILKGAPNPEVAEAFMDFLLTNEGQKLFAELNFEYPIIKDVPLADGVQPLDKFRLANLSLKTLADDIQAGKALMEKAGLP